MQEEKQGNVLFGGLGNASNKKDSRSGDGFMGVIREIEELEKTFVIKGVPEEYKDVWTPNGEIKLWSVPRKTAEILNALVMVSRPKTILELGTSAGYSTLWLAKAAEQYGGKVHTIELAKPKIEMAGKHFQKAGLSECIEQLEGKISDILPRWDKGQIDFVFMDADKKNYLSYLKQLEPFLSEGAVIAADNAIDFKGLMDDYLIYVSESGKYKSRLIEIDNGLMVSVKN